MSDVGRILSFGTYVKLTLLTWLSVIGLDFFLHGGALARLYAEPSPFLLSPSRAFTLIPVGYLSSLCLVVLLVWLMARLGIQGWQHGAIFGLQVGALVWGAFALGLTSISTARPALLAGWFLGQTVQLGIAGMVVGSGLAVPRLGRLLVKVVAFAIGMVVLTVVLQNVGFGQTVSR